MLSIWISKQMIDFLFLSRMNLQENEKENRRVPSDINILAVVYIVVGW